MITPERIKELRDGLVDMREACEKSNPKRYAKDIVDIEDIIAILDDYASLQKQLIGARQLLFGDAEHRRLATSTEEMQGKED